MKTFFRQLASEVSSVDTRHATETSRPRKAKKEDPTLNSREKLAILPDANAINDAQAGKEK